MKKLLKDYYPDLLKELAEDIDLNKLSFGLNVKIKWKCKKDHIYSMRPQHKIRGHNCPYCSNQKVLKGYNDLQTLFPDIAKEWDDDKNDVNPDEITPGTPKKFWWKCSKGHSWQAVTYSRTRSNRHCPYCANNKLLKGYNDLLSQFPDIAKEWSDKNKIKADEIGYYSTKKAWWKCSKGHEWFTYIRNRTKNKYGCPKCSHQTSFGEQSIYYYLLSYNAKNRFKLDNMEIDIYLPEKNIGIEFNGDYWHRDKKDKDLIKEIKLSHKVNMYYIYESDQNKIINNKIYFEKNHNYYNNLEWSLNELFKVLNLNIDVNLNRDYQLIRQQLKKTEYEQTLQYRFPELCKEWDYEKNIIKPDEIVATSNIKAWWKCNKKHSWQAVINNRTGKPKAGCPYCSNQKVLKGYNDLLTTHPLMIKWWDYEKNVIKPDEITYGSGKKVWLKCDEGHSWQSTIYKTTCCPYCKKSR